MLVPFGPVVSHRDCNFDPKKSLPSASYAPKGDKLRRTNAN